MDLAGCRARSNSGEFRARPAHERLKVTPLRVPILLEIIAFFFVSLTTLRQKAGLPGFCAVS
jgi:hypothetical protein